jgi:hypothetical protein
MPLLAAWLLKHVTRTQKLSRDDRFQWKIVGKWNMKYRETHWTNYVSSTLLFIVWGSLERLSRKTKEQGIKCEKFDGTCLRGFTIIKGEFRIFLNVVEVPGDRHGTKRAFLLVRFGSDLSTVIMDLYRDIHLKLESSVYFRDQQDIWRKNRSSLSFPRGGRSSLEKFIM